MTCLSLCGNMSHIAFTDADVKLQQKVWPISFVFFCFECGKIVGFFAGGRCTDTFEHSCGAIQFEATQ